jgi:hypothetical protein
MIIPQFHNIPSALDVYQNIKKNRAQEGLINAQEEAQRAKTAEMQKQQLTPEAYLGQLDLMVKKFGAESPEGMYARNAMANIIRSGGIGAGGSRASGVDRSASLPGIGSGAASGIGAAQETDADINPLSRGRYTLKSAQYATDNPDGSKTVRTAPTMAMDTRNQARASRHAEVQPLWSSYMQGMNPYWGSAGTAKWLEDKFLANLGYKNPERLERLKAYELARSVRPELAKAIDTMVSGGNPTVEGTKSIKDAIENSITMPAEAVRGAREEYNPLQSKALDESLQEAAQNYPIKANQELPWPGQQADPVMEMLNARYGIGEGSQEPRQQEAPRSISSASESIQMPTFNSKAEFQNWVRNQPPEVQKQIEEKLRGAK